MNPIKHVLYGTCRNSHKKSQGKNRNNFTRICFIAFSSLSPFPSPLFFRRATRGENTKIFTLSVGVKFFSRFFSRATSGSIFFMRKSASSIFGKKEKRREEHHVNSHIYPRTDGPWGGGVGVGAGRKNPTRVGFNRVKMAGKTYFT